LTNDPLRTLFDLKGRTAIVTGGTRGIGMAIAEALVSCGANVAVASRKPEACTAAADKLQSLGEGNALGVPTHLGDIDAINRLVAATVDEFGGIDIVINNAANALTLPLGEITPEAWSKSFSVNLQGPVFLVQAALPYLRESVDRVLARTRDGVHVTEEQLRDFDIPGGDSLLVVSTEVVDPAYLSQPYWTSTHFKKQNDASGWNPTPCTSR